MQQHVHDTGCMPRVTNLGWHPVVIASPLSPRLTVACLTCVRGLAAITFSSPCVASSAPDGQPCASAYKAYTAKQYSGQSGVQAKVRVMTLVLVLRFMQAWGVQNGTHAQ